MTLCDHQTRGNIISPYILIGNDDSTRYAVNTSSFAECQDWLVLPDAMVQDMRSEAFMGLGDHELVSVFAVVGDYNQGMPFDYGENRTVSLTRPSRLEQEIGLIPLDVLKKNLPKVYDSIKKP